MKTQIRLNSVVPNGVSGPEAGAINLIYEYWLSYYSQNAYSYININQIGDDFNEVLVKKGKEIYINIRYSTPSDFDSRSDEEKNRMRLEVIHAGLLLIAEKEKKMDISALEEIKDIILANNFSFDFTCKTYKNKKNDNLIAKLIVHPEVSEFKYYIQIEEQSEIKCRKQIYRGNTSGYYIHDLFKLGKWENNNKFILTGKRHEVEIHIIIDQCKIEYVNLTPYQKPPFFEMFKTDNTKEEKEEARNNFENSIPPSIKSAIRKDKDN